MRFQNRVDRTHELFRYNWTRPKRMNSQVNGQTEMSQSTFIRLRDAKANHR
ncbi:YpzG family protein [Caldibacillus thermolactis]|jgi:hypothetical protein|uniref:YpzG family protein n=1 Tax=Pallidibacillus thermolactis TaxID=251051 RepID=A0ABT2WPK3_9BACI|nr:YpzG family protein [Pallidibacillus thermolactis]MCU9595847.1 YpzG family protein [Pallidibacillus thermolactis]MCU9601008.1 YpzG family protein [Pallidibacillus thermolactis subsp. kokeshiiformis]MED1674760.1 YpzG family protein [Pallidibacillus thermolactis subsp. kokeshiiformis]